MTYNGVNRQKKSEEMRKKIYQCAEQLFSEHDLGTVSVESIVQAAGVSKGSFYVHFASKDALFTELVNNKVAMVDAKYQAFAGSLPEDMPVKEMLLSMMDRISDVLTADIGVEAMAMVYRAQLAGDAGVQSVASSGRGIYGMFRRVLECGITRGELRTDMSADVLTRELMMAIRGITYEWCIRRPDFDYKAQAREHLKILLEGMAAPATV